MSEHRGIILITGATGFVGFKTLLLALEAGYTVRSVIRRPEQAQKLKSHPKIVQYASQLDFTVVPDLMAPGAFDDKLENVVAILHLASPLAVESDDYNRDIIEPAVQICNSILLSATKAPSVKRVVVTSSMVTLIPFEWLANPNERVYTAADINPDPTRDVSSAMEAYWSSKALARIAAQAFMKTHKPHYDLVQILPGVINGADDRAIKISDLKKDTPLWELKLSPILGAKQPYPMVGVPIDVADVARAHVDAVRESVPGNKDYLLATGYPGGVVWDSMIDVVQRVFPDECRDGRLPLGGTLPTTKWAVDCGETEEAFGWKFRSFEDTIEQSIGQYISFLGESR